MKPRHSKLWKSIAIAQGLLALTMIGYSNHCKEDVARAKEVQYTQVQEVQVETPQVLQTLEVKESNSTMYNKAKELLPQGLHEEVELLDIEVVQGQLESKYETSGEGDTLGFYSASKLQLVLESDDEEIIDTLGHELGHFIDVVWNYEKGEKEYLYSNSDEFLKAFELESHILFKDYEYAWSKASEYFSEAYNLYIYEDYSDIAPLTYKYIDELYKELDK